MPEMTREERAEAATEILRDATRTAHETISELRQLLRDGEALVTRIEEAASVTVRERVEEAVKVQIDNLGQATSRAMSEAVDKVMTEFNKLEAILLGTDKRSRRAGRTIPDLVERGARKGRRP